MCIRDRSYAKRMPSHVEIIPRPMAKNVAAAIDLATRSAVAAGPISKAVESIEPMAIDDSPTDTARQNINKTPTILTRTPCDEAISLEREVSSNGRRMIAIINTTRPPKMAT